MGVGVEVVVGVMVGVKVTVGVGEGARQVKVSKGARQPAYGDVSPGFFP